MDSINSQSFNNECPLSSYELTTVEQACSFVSDTLLFKQPLRDALTIVHTVYNATGTIIDKIKSLLALPLRRADSDKIKYFLEDEAALSMESYRLIEHFDNGMVNLLNQLRYNQPKLLCITEQHRFLKHYTSRTCTYRLYFKKPIANEMLHYAQDTICALYKLLKKIHLMAHHMTCEYYYGYDPLAYQVLDLTLVDQFQSKIGLTVSHQNKAGNYQLSFQGLMEIFEQIDELIRGEVRVLSKSRDVQLEQAHLLYFSNLNWSIEGLAIHEEEKQLLKQEILKEINQLIRIIKEMELSHTQYLKFMLN